MLFPHICSFLISSFYNICKKTADVRIAPYLLSLILPGIILRTQRLYDLPVAFYSIVLLAHCDQFMDRMSLPGKFLLVLSHNIPSAECRIIVKIIGLRQNSTCSSEKSNSSLLSVLNSTTPSKARILSYRSKNCLEVSLRFA